MNEEEYRKIVRQIDFNRTESEVLVKLVDSASQKGETAQVELKSLRKASEEFAHRLRESAFVHVEAEAALDSNIEGLTSVGIDGSMFPVGGIGGLWYVPYAVVRVVFPNGDTSSPRVDVYAADVTVLREQEDYNIKGQAEKVMMIGETKAIRTWGEKKIPSVVFIDGPCIDPPAWSDEVYVRERSTALQSVLDHSHLMGCVKRSRDAWFLRAIPAAFEGDPVADSLRMFPSDQHFFSFVFTALRKAGARGCLFTDAIEIREDTSNALAAYFKQGMRLLSFFFQRDAGTVPLRFDVPIFGSEVLSSQALRDLAKARAGAVLHWTYSGYDYPLPVMLAHEKCSIRQGCAEILYDEIITRSRSGDPFDQLAAIQLR